MSKLPSSLERVINELSKLPGIGPKSAQRLAFYLLKRDGIEIEFLSTAIADLKSGVTFCAICHNMADSDPCEVCSDSKRDQALLCVVEEPMDVLALDRGSGYSGVFHVLGGVLNPLEGIGVESLNIGSLISRIRNSLSAEASAKEGQSVIREIIIATNPTLEGETTAMQLSKMLRAEFPTLTLTRIARGLPMGGDLEYADEITLTRALEGRREY